MRPVRETVLDTAESLIQYGMVWARRTGGAPSRRPAAVHRVGA
ncbi:hypothetical protein ACQP1G_23315 [Nocardia sp. CA-107356]